MTQPIRGRAVINRLSLRHFRNLRECVFEPAPQFNLIYGSNGHGKTSLIEALYVLCTTKSFRTTRLADVILEGEERAQIAGKVSALGLDRELRASIGSRGRSFLLDGKRPQRQLDYALKTPVIAFHPGDLTLASGPASVRRLLLDRIVLHQDPAGSDARTRYQLALRDRQKLLLTRGTRGAELDAYEQVIATHGARYAEARAHAARAVIEALLPALSQMAAPSLACEMTYQPGGTCDAEVFRRELEVRRERDRQRGAASFGPHRDELLARLNGRPARSHASQGQQRLLSLALKLAEHDCIREVTGMEPVLLLDDVSSELDPERTDAVFAFLRAARSQIFVTTTRPELFESVHLGLSVESAVDELRADFLVSSGQLQRVQK